MHNLFWRRWLLLIAVVGWLSATFYSQGWAQAQSGRVINNANLRVGPGTNYAVAGRANAGDTVAISSCNSPCTWYQLSSGVWIAAFLVEVRADVPSPAATLTQVPTTVDAPLTVASWNVELNDADPQIIGAQMAQFEDVDLWGIAEVNRSEAVPPLEAGAENGESADFRPILSQSGGGDRLLILYNADKFALVEVQELNEINTTGNARAPLVAHLRQQDTSQEFLFMVNHLYRSRDAERHKQAMLLNQWVATQTLPVIAVGDYNFDWEVQNGVNNHDAGYDALTAGERFTWLQPQKLVTTQCSGWPCQFESVLDFVFTAGEASKWKAESEIVVRAGDFPDDNTTSDHRPLLARFWPQSAPTASALPTATATSVTVASCPTANRTANLRGGPGTNYAIAGSVTSGACLTLVAQTLNNDWYRLAGGSWIAAFLVNNGPTNLPVESAPAPAANPIVANPIVANPVVANPVVAEPVVVEPSPTPTPQPAPPQPAQQCDPSYPDMCIPPGVPDLDCGDISQRRFRVLSPDPHRFDGDHDGIGCESG